MKGQPSPFPGDPYPVFGEAFERAAAAAGGIVPMPVVLGGVRLLFEFAGSALLPRLGAPFEHLRTAGGPAATTVRAWDSESTGIGLPKELPTPGTVYAQSLPAMSEGGGQRWTYFRPDPGLTVFDSRTQAGIYWVPAASSLTYGDIAGGFRAIIAWAMAERGMVFLHSAAVAWAGHAALIVGASGSGKSSTALSCLLAGLEYLGDDHCLLELGDEPRVHSVYAAAKLHDAQLARFPELDAFVVNRDRVAPEKGVAILYPAFRDLLPMSRTLSAVFVPRITGEKRTVIVPAGPAAALAALAPSTLLQMASADREGLATMGRLVRQIPCFSLQLGTDRREIAETIRDFLAERSTALE
ncbi:hypothetical protein [Candidatus Amarobacter glycogenicus]|uniref:hypothetical protein n=1 Tax=Candidatus Amarobacter glycogenicus TaxID=3140699 RepID=UPI002A104BFA|nr:hypothetical protein [Dehalococcoidia bacterium]